jgi:hypothetical protein
MAKCPCQDFCTVPEACGDSLEDENTDNYFSGVVIFSDM